MTTNKWREGIGYLQVQPGRLPWELKVVRVTQRRPSVVDADSVVIKVKLRVPVKAFEPLQPEAVVTVPEELVQHPVEVEAADPS
jgi:hypothetical protein